MKNFIKNLTRIPKVVWIALGAVALDVLRRIFLGNECGIKQLFGIACPACGMTRAYLSLLMLDLEKAFYYNPAFLTYPIALLTGVLAVLDKKHRALYITLFILAIAVLFAVWIYRLIAGKTV